MNAVGIASNFAPRGDLMKKLNFVLSFAVITLCVLGLAGRAKADGVDPSIIVFNASLEPPVSGTTFSFFTTTGGDCNFTSPSGTPGDCTMTNTNSGGNTWTGIDVNITQMIDKSFVSCNGGPFFASCAVTNNGDGTVNVDFTGGPGVSLGTTLGWGIAGWATTCTDTTTGAGCVTFNGTISTVPEPGSLILLLSGGSALLALRRRRNTA